MGARRLGVLHGALRRASIQFANVHGLFSAFTHVSSLRSSLLVLGNANCVPRSLLAATTYKYVFEEPDVEVQGEVQVKKDDDSNISPLLPPANV